jgi:pyridine nucleotide-disulfide oxidoreductase family protein
MTADTASVETRPPPRRIVLIGAGHAHLQIIDWWSQRPQTDVELILLTAFEQASYSGLFPDEIARGGAGHSALIALPALCERSRVRLIVDRLSGMNPTTRMIDCAHHPSLRYDVASINIGSVPRHDQLCQTHRTLISIKPMATFTQRLERRLDEWRSQQDPNGTDSLRLAIVGGGAAGVELALALAARFRNQSFPVTIALYSMYRELLSTHLPRTRWLAKRALRAAGIQLHTGTRIVGCDDTGPHALIQDNGVQHPCDLAIWATGAAPPAVLSRLGLPLSPTGFLTVRSTLQSTGDEQVFVVGDSADFPEPIPKSGVYAVRQGPVLRENLRRVIAGEPCIEYRPQAETLSLIGCADGTAILDYRGWSMQTRWAWWWKQRIDHAFMRRFQ